MAIEVTSFRKLLATKLAMEECVLRIQMSTQCSASAKFFGAKPAELHTFFMFPVIIFIYKKLVAYITHLVLIFFTFMNTTHMGSFPQPHHFFAAAQEKKDFGALRIGPSMPSKYKLFVDTKNSALETSGFEGSKFLQKC